MGATDAVPDDVAASPRDGGDRFGDGLIQPFLLLTGIGVTAVQLWTDWSRVTAPPLAVGLFCVVGSLALALMLLRGRLPERTQLAMIGTYGLCAAVLLPLAQATIAPVFAFVACAVAGERLASRRAALTVAIGTAVTTSLAIWVVQQTHPATSPWPWLVGLVAGFPVLGGMGRRDRRMALLDAQRAAAEAERAGQAEAREAALLERARIAREIHDVLGHSLSGIGMQLDMAEALHDKGRDDEAFDAVTRARALAVDSMTETRHAIAALREDALPLPETLRLLADSGDVTFTVTGTPAPVSTDAAHALVRAAQEALTNAAKYAPGAARAMTLAFTPDRILLTVSNPPGTTPAVGSGSGMGLIGMRERIALLGGTLRAGPDPATGGWTVRAEVPR